MATPISPEELQRLLEFTRRAAEDKSRRNSNAAALQEARKQIEEQGRFVPKVDQPHPIEICF
jgi:hypothetical protein